MFVNIDAVPVGKSLYTVYLTGEEELSPDVPVEEIDLIATADVDMENWGQVVNENMTEVRKLYGDDIQFVGVVNQSSGYVVWQHPETKR